MGAYRRALLFFAVGQTAVGWRSLLIGLPIDPHMRVAAKRALTACALLVVALLCNASRGAIAAASIFYLVGAVVGLCGRLRAESQSGTAVHDYGFSSSVRTKSARIDIARIALFVHAVANGY
jgi:hypothetical protein